MPQRLPSKPNTSIIWLGVLMLGGWLIAAALIVWSAMR